MGGGGASDARKEEKKRKKKEKDVGLERKEEEESKKKSKSEDRKKEKRVSEEKEEKREKKKAKKEKEAKKDKDSKKDKENKKEKKSEKEVKDVEDEQEPEEDEAGLDVGSELPKEASDRHAKKSSSEGPHKVYAGGFSYYCTEDELKGLFEECGKVVEVDMMTFPDTGRFRGIAFITFEDEKGVEAAIKYDNTDYNGRYLRIRKYEVRGNDNREYRSDKKTQYREPPAKVQGYNVAYVGNLSWSVDEDSLREFFKDYSVTEVRLAKDRETGRSRGFAHVTFGSEQDLDGAMQLDGQMFLSRPVRLGYGQK